VASSICLRATIFQNPEGTLWTHCISVLSYCGPLFTYGPRHIPKWSVGLFVTRNIKRFNTLILCFQNRSLHITKLFVSDWSAVETCRKYKCELLWCILICRTYIDTIYSVYFYRIKLFIHDTNKRTFDVYRNTIASTCFGVTPSIGSSTPRLETY
jgi:hypothetical protein